MPILFWLALLLGYLTGVAAAVLLLPSRLIEPLYGPLALTTVLALAAFGVLLRLRRVRQRAESVGAAPRQDPPPGPRRSRGLAAAPDALEPGEELPDGPDQRPDERRPLLLRLEPPGAIGPAELREILYQGRVDVRVRPLARLNQPDAALYYALPRLRSAADEHLEPARYLTTAARTGLLGMIDRLLLLRCIDLLRATRVDGRAATVVCGVATTSLDDPAFVAELEQQLSAEPALAAALVLALDHAVHDRPSVAAAARLRERGVRFCLRRLGPPPLDAEGLRAAGFAFVLLEAGRFRHDGSDDGPDPALQALQELFGAAGPELLILRTRAQSITIVGEWAFSAADDTFDLARSSAA